MANSYDYNEVQPGASDIDREAWPVMYDPYGDDDGLKEVSTKDTNTVDLSGKGTSNSKLSADVKVSKQENNALKALSDGLYVADKSPVLSIKGSEFIDVSSAEPQRPVISLKKSEDESNDLVDNGGLYVHVPVKEIQGSDTVDVSKEDDTWSIDVKLDPNQGNVILSTENGLKAEIASGVITEVEGSNSISATKSGNVYTLDTLISTATDNALQSTENGLYVPNTVVPEDFIKSVDDTDSITLTVDENAKLTADVKVDNTNPGNVTFSFTPNGLKGEVEIPADYVTGVQDTADVKLSVNEGILSAEIASGVIPEIRGSESIDVQTSGNVNVITTNISSAADNMISVASGGLYVPPTEIPDVPVKSLVEGNCIEITENPSGTFEIGTKVSEFYDNDLTTKSDGLYVRVPVKEFTEGNGIEINDYGGEGNFTIGLKGYSIENLDGENGVNVQSDVDETSWTISANISEDEGNKVEISENDQGLYVGPELPSGGSVGQVLKKTANGSEWGDEQTQYVSGITDSNTISLAVDQGQLSASANISNESGNILEDRNGLYVPNSVIPQDFIRSVGNTDSISLNVDANGELTASARIDTNNPGNVHLSITEDGLVASADIPEDYINNVVDSETVHLSVDDGDLSASAKVSSKGDNQTDPANALEIEQDGLWTPTLYLGPFDSSARPSEAITGQYIFDTDLGYCLYRHGGAWVNSTGAIVEGNVEPTGQAVDWLVNPMTAYGDLLVGGPSGTPSAMHVGPSGAYLKSGENGLEWGEVNSLVLSDLADNTATVIEDGQHDGLYVPPSSLEGMITTAGDLIAGDASGEPDTLSKGTVGQVLTSTQNGIEWQTGIHAPNVEIASTNSTDLTLSSRNAKCQIYTDSSESIYIKTSDDALSAKMINIISEQEYGDPDQYGNRARYQSYVQILDTYGVYMATNNGTINISNYSNNLNSYIQITNQGSSNIKIYGQNGLTIGALNDNCKTYYGWSDTLMEGGLVNVKSKSNTMTIDGYSNTFIYSRNGYVRLEGKNGIYLNPNTNAGVYANTNNGGNPNTSYYGASFSLTTSSFNTQTMYMANHGTASEISSSIVVSQSYAGVSIVSQNPYDGTFVAKMTYSSEGSLQFDNYPSEYDDTKTYELLGIQTDDGTVDKVSMTDAFNSGSPITSYGDLIYGDASGIASALPIGTEGQALVVDSYGQIAWEDKPRSCQENYAFVNSTNIESADDYKGRLFVSRVICNHDGNYSELGFALKSGTTGKVGMAIYDVNSDLVARTELIEISNPTIDGYIYWHETENEYVLHAGEEYYFAIWFGDYPYSNTLQVFAKVVDSSLDALMMGTVIGQQSITEMPTTLGTLNYERYCFHMSAR